MSTGYSPVDGLPGEQSSGTIDPSLPMMMAKGGKSTSEIRQLLAGESGWQTIHDPESFRLRSILHAIGSLAASAGDLKYLVFFGEPVESNRIFTQAVCTRLNPFGLALPEQDFPSSHGIIPLTSRGSRIEAIWIPETISNIYQQLIQQSTKP
jgi:acetate kinase